MLVNVEKFLLKYVMKHGDAIDVDQAGQLLREVQDFENSTALVSSGACSPISEQLESAAELVPNEVPNAEPGILKKSGRAVR